MELPDAVWHLVLTAGIAASLATVWWLARPAGRWGQLARKRLLLGVPWGTLITVLGVGLFYLFVQNGIDDPTDPLVIPFRAWGYFYPTGMVTAGFAHASLGHITGNLLGTLVFGSLAEYAWSHFPTDRGEASFSSLRTNPFARIAAWILAIVTISVVSGFFALGPVIGFSGVVFAFVGFALVRFPLATIASLLVSRVVTQVYTAVRLPQLTAQASETFSRPWWADIAIQGHALGLFIGVILSIGLLYKRGVRPKASHVWLAALVFGVDRGLWAIYTIEGTQSFTLYRALGVALVFLIAALIASGATASARDLISSIDLSRREAAFGLLLATLFALGLVAIPFNLFVVDDATAGLDEAEPVEAGDYTVFYAEDVEHQYIPAVPIPGGDGDERINASGVIVVSEQRNIWWEEVSANRLASRGSATVKVGGVAWSESVRASRTTWNLADGNSTYHVRLGDATAETRPVVFRGDRASADARIDGRNISVEPVGDGFELVVTDDSGATDRGLIPEEGETNSVGGITFEREGRNLFAERGATRIRIAQHRG